MEDWTLTLGAVARGSKLCDATIREYVRLGLLECRLDSTGRRLFRADSAAQASEIAAQRLAHRGSGLRKNQAAS